MAKEKNKKNSLNIKKSNSDNTQESPSTSDKKTFFRKIELSDWQKNFISVVLSVLLVAAILFGYNWYSNPSFKDRFLPQKQTDSVREQANQDLAKSLDELSAVLNKVTPEEYIFVNVKFTDLPIYPDAWVERYFNRDERVNSLVSGPSGDPDGDGLSNKQEYLLSSNPKNSNTLCENLPSNETCGGLTDRENAEKNISPLTGESIDIPASIRMKRQDLNVITQSQNSFDTAYREGLDFPSLYQLSKKIDLSSELENIKVNSISNDRNNIIDYLQVRIDVLQDFIDDNELTSFTKIYQINNAVDLDKIANKYYAIRDRLYTTSVPQKYESMHKVYILLFQKLANLVLHRKDGLKLENNITDEFKELSKKKGVEIVWSYRRLSQELSKLSL